MFLTDVENNKPYATFYTPLGLYTPFSEGYKSLEFFVEIRSKLEFFYGP